VSLPAAAPSRARYTGRGRYGSQTLHAEWTKLRTLASTGWLLLGAAVLTVAVSTAADAAATCSARGCQPDSAKLTLTGVQAGQAIVAVLAILAISNEYSTAMIRVTLTAMPRRLTVLAAKAALVAGLVLRAACGSVLYLTLMALLSLGVATAVRESAVAIGLVLGLLYVFPVVTSVIGNQHWQRHLEQIGPMTAGLDIQATVNLSSLPLTPWAGLGVLALWAAGALIIGALMFCLRDA